MNSWLMFLLKSTAILSLLYLVFRILMSSETFFKLSRITLLTIVLMSVVIPIVNLPAREHPVTLKLSPALFKDNGSQIPVQSNQVPVITAASSDIHAVILPLRSVIITAYIAGAVISLLYFIYSVLSVFRLLKNSRRHRLNGVDLLVSDRDIPAFSFKRNILISEKDLVHAESIVAHELSHIRLGHFYDLMFMELVKIIYWFNPLVYRLNRDLKDIHEYQADEDALGSGIDAAGYQMLIIQKCVGQQSFALANSFNHCQIKKRITMMNKSKTCKARRWKVATFLPVLALLLMAFGNRGEVAPGKPVTAIDIAFSSAIYQNKYAEFKHRIEIRKDGNYIDNKMVSLEEIAAKGKEWYGGKSEWILLLADESVPLNRIDEVRKALKHNYWIVQATANSNDFVYFSGDVSELAKFKQGRFSDWLSTQLKNFPEIRKGKENMKIELSFSFIIGQDGKVRDAHIINGSGYPDVDAAYEKVLSHIPDWIPAKRAGVNVSVYEYNIGSLISYVPPKK